MLPLADQVWLPLVEIKRGGARSDFAIGRSHPMVSDLLKNKTKLLALVGVLTTTASDFFWQKKSSGCDSFKSRSNVVANVEVFAKTNQRGCPASYFAIGSSGAAAVVASVDLFAVVQFLMLPLADLVYVVANG